LGVIRGYEKWVILVLVKGVKGYVLTIKVISVKLYTLEGLGSIRVSIYGLEGIIVRGNKV
jgi:hypothetical protein